MAPVIIRGGGIPLQSPDLLREGGHGVPEAVEGVVGALVEGRGAVEDEAPRVGVGVGVRVRQLAREAHAVRRRRRRRHEERLVRPRRKTPARLHVWIADQPVVRPCGDCAVVVYE